MKQGPRKGLHVLASNGSVREVPLTTLKHKKERDGFSSEQGCRAPFSLPLFVGHMAAMDTRARASGADGVLGPPPVHFDAAEFAGGVEVGQALSAVRAIMSLLGARARDCAPADVRRKALRAGVTRSKRRTLRSSCWASNYVNQPPTTMPEVRRWQRKIA